MANNLSKGVKLELSSGEICHREPEFTQLLGKVRENILNIVNGNEEFTTVMITGSGTAAIEATISSLPKETHIGILNNGTYGERIKKITERYNIPFTEIKTESFPNLTKVENLIKDEKITHFAFVHHETSTGMLNPLEEISELCKNNNKTLIVDAISSIAVQELDIAKNNVDFLIGSSNKGIAGPEGLSFIIVKKEELEKTKDQGRNFYFDLYNNYKKQEKGQTPFTPAVRIFSGLNKGLDELNEEGVENRIKRFENISRTLREGMISFGFEILTDLDHASNVTTLIKLKNKSYDKLYSELKKKGFIIYSGINKETFRLCTFGDLKVEDILEFLDAIKEVK